MNIIENIRLAFSSLLANKMRALLTMLGIIIGIGSVIAIMTVGDSLTGYVSESMAGLGSNNIYLSIQSKKEEGRNNMPFYAQGNSSTIDEKHLLSNEMLIDLLQSFPEEIKAISISDTVGNGQTTSGKLYANLSLVGVNPEYALAENISIEKGRFINQNDDSGGRKVAVVSDKLAANMFGNENPLGKQITINAGNHTGVYTIVGIYTYETNNMMGVQTTSDKDTSTSVYIPLTTANKITKTHSYQSVVIITNIGVDVDSFIADVSQLFAKYYSRNNDFGISLTSMESMMDTVTSMLGAIELAIAAIAAISLLVGGIGVMNIMMVSITERTKEIGTRKALGATNGDIRIQFVVEAIIICLIGGIIGVALGISLGLVASNLLGAPATASISTIALATLFSMAIGVFFGYYPANKAAKLNPIDALRYE